MAQKQHKPRIFFTNNRNKLFCLDAYTGKLIKTFGKNGTIKIGLSPIPPVIYKDNLIIIDTQSRMKVFDLFSGKIKWKYKTPISKGLFKTIEWYSKNYNYFKQISKKNITKRLGLKV